MPVSLANAAIGVDLPASEVLQLIGRMGLTGELAQDKAGEAIVRVRVPPTRSGTPPRRMRRRALDA